MKLNKKHYVIIFLSILITTGLLINTWHSNQLDKFEDYTTGEIINFEFVYQSHQLTYRYVVNGKTYENSESTNYFKCDDGTPGCKGKEFTVRYSSKNPKNSEIDLGKFNEKKLIRPSL